MSSPSPTLKPVHTWPSPLSSTSRCASVLTLTKSSVSDQVKHQNTPFLSLLYAVPILRSSLRWIANNPEDPETITYCRLWPLYVQRSPSPVSRLCQYADQDTLQDKETDCTRCIWRAQKSLLCSTLNRARISNTFSRDFRETQLIRDLC